MRLKRKKEIIKKADLEAAAGVTDSYSKLKGFAIRVSTTVRRKIRDEAPEEISSMPNPVLNDYIAKIFSHSGEDDSGILHHFIAKHKNSPKKEFIQIRLIKDNLSNQITTNYSLNMRHSFFFAVIRKDTIDIITLSDKYNKPAKGRMI